MKHLELTAQKVLIKAYSVKEIAGLYNISPKTLRRWLTPFAKEIGERKGHSYTPKQIRIIFEELGIPGDYLN
jgi:uncharacterized protein YjcR